MVYRIFHFISKSNNRKVSEETITQRFKQSNPILKKSTFYKASGKGLWNILCPKCSYDAYVTNGYCNGIFSSRQSDLSKGQVSCRCSKFYKKTVEMVAYNLTNHLTEKGYKFISFPDGYKNNRSAVKFECIAHGIQKSCVDTILNINSYCRECSVSSQVYGYINEVMDGDQIVGFKFGITNNLKARLRSQNNKNKFLMRNFKVIAFPCQAECWEWENKCKELIAVNPFTKQDMPDGFTETFPVSDIDRILALIP